MSTTMNTNAPAITHTPGRAPCSTYPFATERRNRTHGKARNRDERVKKNFGKTHAVAGVDLAVSAGGVYGVLDPNGAGKTTAIRMPATLLHPDAGEAQVLPLALLVVAAVIAWARRSSNSILVDILRR
jgi:ABC-type polysaccharide/polyol phosphate transport system ATPase subunit